MGPVPAGVLDLHHGGADRHDDGRRNTEPAGVVGDALSVIAGRHGDHAAPLFVLVQGREAVECAALLEACGELQVLELEPDVAAEDLTERAARRARRDRDRAGNGATGCFDVREADGTYTLVQDHGSYLVALAAPAGRQTRSV